MSGEEDAAREIFGYTSHLPVPVWVDKNAYPGCYHCKAKFSSFSEASKPHNCRLCGHMLCGSCTAKYHVPLVYEQKGKKGPTRVCIRCRDSCLAQKEREKNAALALQPARHAVLSSLDLKGPVGAGATRASQFVGAGQIEIAPPVWDDIDKYVECGKCHKKGGKPHSQILTQNRHERWLGSQPKASRAQPDCRTCGKLYCDDCTSKMVIPPFFEKKKKVGPARVCGECRFKILGGAKLVERLSTDLPELDAAAAAGDAAGSGPSSATACIAPGCGLSRVSKTGYCASHLNEHGGGDTGDLAASASLSIRWEGESSLLAKVALTDRSMNLMQVDLALRKLVPAFAKRDDYEYLYRSEGIPEVFYDIFTAATFAPQGNNIYIRKKVDTDLLVAAYARQGVSGRSTASAPGLTRAGSGGAASAGVDAVPQANNPFRASRREEEKKNAPAKKIERKVATPIFRKPAAAKPFQRAGAAPAAKKLPPPPPPPAGGAGSSSRPPPPPLPAGAAGPEVFRQRAKMYFGAL